MSAETLVASRTIVLDDVPYAFRIYQTAQSFTGVWNCEHCQTPSLRTMAAPGRGRAIWETEKAIYKHHTKRHPAIAVGAE